MSCRVGRAETIERLALVVLLVLAGILRLELLDVRSLWFDEGYSLFVAGLGPGRILEFLRHNDAHPPAYYLLLSWWMRTFGSELGTLRLPSFASGWATVLLTWVLARRWVGEWGALLAATLVAFNPFQVYASNELRMYAPLAAVVLLCVLTLDRAVTSDGAGSWIAFGVLIATAAYTSYFAILVGLAQVVWAVATRGLRGSGRLLLALLIASALYAPWTPFLVGLRERNPQQWVLRPSLADGGILPYALSLLTAHASGGYLPNTVTYHRPSVLVFPYLLPLLPFSLVWVFGVLRLVRGRGVQAAVVWLGGVALVVAASAVLARQVAYPRNVAFLQPLAAIVAAAGVVELGRRRAAGKWVAGVTALAMVGLCAVGTHNLQSGKPEFDAYRFDRAARYLNARVRPQDLLIYLPTGVEHPLGYYLKTRARSVSFALPVTRWNEEGAAEVARKLNQFLGQVDGKVWLVTHLPATWWKPVLLPVFRTMEASGLRRAGFHDFLGVLVVAYERP